MKLLWLNSGVQIIDYLSRDLQIDREEVKYECFVLIIGIRVIEDDYHLISICPLYQRLRSTFMQDILRDNTFNAFWFVMS